MIWPRAIISALVAVAIALAPIGAAWANSVAHRGVEISSAPHHQEVASEAAAEAKLDCASMMRGTTESHPPCCAKELACPPEFCIAKCFKLVSFLELASTQLPLRASRVTAFDHTRPPDWSSRPPPPPPRT